MLSAVDGISAFMLYYTWFQLVTRENEQANKNARAGNFPVLAFALFCLCFFLLGGIAQELTDVESGDGTICHCLGDLQDTADTVASGEQTGNIGLIAAVYLLSLIHI